jgi:hypothetical protein
MNACALRLCSKIEADKDDQSRQGDDESDQYPSMSDAATWNRMSCPNLLFIFSRHRNGFGRERRAGSFFISAKRCHGWIARANLVHGSASVYV